MKKIVFILFVFIYPAFAQSDFEFEFDYAQFGYDTSSNYVEFYYSFNEASLKVNSENSNAKIEGLLKIFIKDDIKGDTIVFNQWKLKHDILDTSIINSQILVGTLGFIVPKGSFTCEITGSDMHNPDKFRLIKENIKVVPYMHHSMSISDIQLASKMIQGSENTSSIFYKNTYEVIPIPNVVFGISQPALFFYLEVYNLQSDSIKSEQVKMSQMIYNSKGKLVKEKSKYLSRTSNTRVEVGSHILSNYPTDSYTLVIALIDSVGNTGVSSAKKFFVYNPDVQVTDTFEVSTTAVLSSSFGSMSEEELDDLFDKSEYLATKTEIDKYEKLSNLEGKREYMFDFWKAKDENANLNKNEFYRNYMQRVQICNERYTSMGKQGWKTDRGRVFLLYGEPTEIERYPNQLETRPYEIWQYTEIEGGVYFVFADLTGFSDYTILHSTKRGELRDDNWQRRIVVR
ncbi:MAG: GWxTD domain-containing protein [Ignavibacteriales bacterium]|nr:GWxTD domain-containing protein [Ignavibacteriales bacterium]MBP9119520.1 GWxTD domain-containing protein [Ignavibacterium sp.]